MKALIAFTTLLFSFNSFAHPVIYKDGWALSSANMADYSNNYVMHSFTNKFAIGVDHWRFTKDDADTEMGLLKLNHLLWRSNGEDYQANVYVHGGVGVRDQEWNPRGTFGDYVVGAEADWETRKLFSSLKYYQFSDINMTQARVGFSPNIADFKSLQTWFMVQGMVIDDINETVMITPLLRFFYQNVLWEIGSSTRGDWMLNLMVHY